MKTTEGLLDFAPSGQLILHEEYHNHPQSRLLLHRYVEVLTPVGKPLLRNDKLQGQDLGGTPFPHEAVSSYNKRRVRLDDGTRVLLISHVHFIASTPLLIRLGYSAEPLAQQVAEFTGLLLLAVPLALLAAGFAGYRMALKVLRPLEDMALQAESITASHLDQCLPIKNPHDEFGHIARVFNDLLD